MQTPNGIVASCLLIWVGCQQATTSRDVKTQNISMEAEVVAGSDGAVVVRVVLRERSRTSNTYVVLDGEDELIVRVSDGERTMNPVQAGVYETTFDGDQEEIEAFRILLVRSSHDDAQGTLGALPQPFEITTEFRDTTLSRAGDDIEIAWHPSGTEDEMLVEVKRVGCFFLERAHVGGDPGSFVLPKGSLTPSDPSVEECDAVLSVWRSRTGRVDEALADDSLLRLRQVRSINFVSSK